MPDLGERPFCSEKIFVPPSFPSIMKGYCKAAIRTQPYDLLKWSAAYFRALADGENPPVKERLEFPAIISPPGLTPGYLKVLVNQLGKDPTKVVESSLVVQKWSSLCLPPGGLDPLLSLFAADSFPWLRFIAVAAGSISSTLTQTMILICELLSNDPEGGRAAVSVDVFTDLYEFLAYLDCGPSIKVSTTPSDTDTKMNENESSLTTKESISQNNEENQDPLIDADLESKDFPGIGPKLESSQVDRVIEFMKHWAEKQDGMIMPRNIRHWMCPPLDQSLSIGA